jgi:predicted phage tail component-like protein
MADVNFNGTSLSAYAKVLDIRRDILAPRSIQTIDVPSRDGSYIFGRKVEPRIFEVDIMIIGNLEANRSNLARLLDTKTAVPIEFSDKPGVEYFGMLSGESVVEQIRHTGKVTLAFFIAEPYGYGADYSASIPSSDTDGLVDITVEGDADAYPEVTVDFVSDSTFFAIAHDGKYLQLGRSETVEQPPVEREQIIFADNTSSTSSWTPITGALEDTTSLDGAIASNGYAFHLANVGTGTGWHGAAIAKSLPSPVQDFVFQVRLQHMSLSPTPHSRMGKIDIFFRNAAGENVAKITLKEDNLTHTLNRAQIGLGQYGSRTLLMDNRNPNLNDFSGVVRFRREGNRITAQFAQHVNGKPVWSTSTEPALDVAGKFDDPVVSIVVMMSAFGEKPASQMYVDDMHLWRVNDITPSTQTDMVFKAGDQLVIDMKRAAVFLNGNNAIQHVIPGSRFFGLPPGLQTVGVIPVGKTNTTINYESRWH